MYRVSYVYTARPSVYFRKKKDAIAFCANEICATEIHKETLFGWKKIKKSA